MSHLLGGLVFPQEVLVSPWFLLLATVVAFNTIIYLGLTISKFVPWPRQFQPRKLRRTLHRFGALPDEDGAPPMSVIDVYTPTNPYDKIRSDIVRRDVPMSMALVGVAMVAISVVNFVLAPANVNPSHIAQLFLGLLFVVMALVTGRRSFRARITMWLWSILSLMAVALTAEEAMRDGNATPLGYALIFMVAFGPIAMAWTPALTALAGMWALFTWATFVVNDVQDRQFALVGLVAAATGAYLLRMRLQSVAAIAEQWEATQKVASTDVLTGLLTKRGLLDMLPPFMATAARQRLRLTVTVVDVRNLAELNFAYGNAYGDEVMRAVARALSSTVNRSFLVSRWVGARFVVVGFGLTPNDIVLERRLDVALEADPVTLGKAQPLIAVASAEGEPDMEHFDEVYDLAVRRAEAPNFMHTAIVR